MTNEENFFNARALEQTEYLLSRISGKDYPSRAFVKKVLSKLYRMPKSVISIFIEPLRDFYFENVKNMEWVEKVMYESDYGKHPCSGDLIHIRETLKALYELEDKYLLKIWDRYSSNYNCAGAFIFFFPYSFIAGLDLGIIEDFTLRKELEGVVAGTFLNPESDFAKDYLIWKQRVGGHFWTFAVEKRIADEQNNNNITYKRW